MKRVIWIAAALSVWAGIAYSAGSVSIGATTSATKQRIHAIEAATDAAR
ncbi:hypothetical protein [Acidovorax sp.]|jgi:hypothetical protein|nr:hypothetical protein [Acidovorax sp.]